MRRYNFIILLSGLLVMVLLIISSGCTPDPEIVEEEEDKPAEEIEETDLIQEEPEDDDLEPATNYFWPLLSHAQLVLSSSEIISSPSLLESDPGFVGEFTRDSEYKGRIIWLVEKTEVFEVEWVLLTFDVEYYAQHDLQLILNYVFEIENLKPKPAQEGLQVFDLGQVEEKEGFRVEIESVILGKDQEGSFTVDPIDFVALDISITVIDKPE